MRNPLPVPESEERLTAAAEDPREWDKRRSSVATARERSVAIAIALRALRSAQGFKAILAALEDTLKRYLGASAFALFELHEASWRAVITHGLAADEVARFSAHERGPTNTPALVWCPLRYGEETLAWLAIYGLAYGKRSLDAFDIELIDAIGPFVATAFDDARTIAATETVRPASLRKMRTP